MSSNDIVVRIRAEAADFKAGMEDAANAVRARTDDMRSGLAALSDQVQSFSDGLDTASHTMGVASDIMDTLGWDRASSRIDQLNGRVEQVTGVVATAGGVLSELAGWLGHTSDEGASAADSQMTFAQSAAHTAVAVAETTVAVAGAGMAIRALVPVVAEGYVIYKLASWTWEGAKAFGDWVAEASGATAVAQAFSAEAAAQAEAMRVLTLQYGEAAQSFRHITQIAADYGVSSDQASAAIARMVEVLDGQTQSAQQARAVLAAYGLDLSKLSGKDAAAALDQFAQALNGVRDGSAKTGDVIAVMGQDGVKWLKGIADGAGTTSHAFTEADRIQAAMAADIEASKRRIATAPHVSWMGQMSDWADGVAERFGKLTSRSDEFKASQVYALSEVVTAWNEYRADVLTLGDAWTRVKVGFMDYAEVVLQHAPALKSALGLGDFHAPDAPKDRRPAAPVHGDGRDHGAAHADGGGAAMAGYQEELQRKLLLKENWGRQDHALEVQFWQDKIAAEQSEGLEENSALMGLLRDRLSQSQRAQAQWQQSQSDASARAAQQDAAQQLRIAEASAESKKRLAEMGVDGEIEAIHRRAAAGQITAVQETQALAEANARKRQVDLDAAQQHLALVRASAAADVAEVRKAQDQIREITTRNALETQKDQDAIAAARRADEKAAANDNANTARQLSQQRLAEKRAALDTEVQLGQISAADKLATLREMAAQEAAIDQQALERKRDTYAQGSAEWQKAQNALVLAKAKSDAQIEAMDRQAAIDAMHSWQSTLSPITQSFDRMLQGMGQGTQNFHQVERNMLRNLVLEFVNSRLRIEMDWLAGQAAMAMGAQNWTNRSVLAWLVGENTKTAATETGNAQRTVADASSQSTFLGRVVEQVAQWLGLETAKTADTTTGAGDRTVAVTTETAAAITASKSQAAMIIPAETAVAAMGAASAVASTPYVGPALAVAAAKAMTDMGAGYLAMASAAGGAERVGTDGAIFELHKDEMVLPSYISNPMREQLAANRWGIPKLSLGGPGQGSGITTPQATGSSAESAPPAWAQSMVAMMSKVLAKPANVTVHAVDAASINNLLQRQGSQPGLSRALTKLHASGVRG